MEELKNTSGEFVIRKAQERDIPGMLSLLYQVNQVHADGRPDLFKNGGIKYTETALAEKLQRTDEVIFVAVDATGFVKGYVFGQFEMTEETSSLQANKTFYIDDLCVDEKERGKHVGAALYNYTKEYAREHLFDRITLHVWECNPGAMKFYERIGFEPLYTAMEVKLNHE